MIEQQYPKISIIVPVYNVQNYLHRCIDSLINQTMKEIEIILINDGSTDNSGGICDEYSSNYKQIKVIHIENLGVSNARNIGIKESIGVFIMFLDSDDWIDHETCETAYAKAKETDADIVFWSWQKESPKSSFKDSYLENNSSILIENNVDKLKIRCIGLLDDELNDPTKTDYFNTPWAKLYKRSFLIWTSIKFIERKKVGMEDVLFNIEIFQHVNKITYIPKYFNHYRIDNPNSLTKTDTQDLSTKFYYLFAAIKKLKQNHPRFQEALNNRIAMSLINNMLSITSKQNRNSKKVKINQTMNVLDNIWTVEALENFNFRALPIHWKIFIHLCKYRFAAGVYVMTLAMRIFRKTN